MWTRTTDVNCCQMCVLKSIFLKSLYKTAYFAHSGHCLTQGSNASQWLWINNSECWHSWMEPLLFMAATGTNSRWLSHIWNQAVLSTVLAPIVTHVSQGSLFLVLCFVYCIFLFFIFYAPVFADCVEPCLSQHHFFIHPPWEVLIEIHTLSWHKMSFTRTNTELTSLSSQTFSAENILMWKNEKQ